MIAALVTAIASLIVALWTQHSNRKLTKLKSELDEEAASRTARRDYEFEARKRLYAECEPLFFQALELAEDARSRVVTLARTTRAGYLKPDGSGWLDDDEDYFYKSTAFMLLAPITSYKILQRRLTMIDLGLERRLQTQYELLKLIFLSFTRDFELAGCEQALTYKPDDADPGVRGRDKLLRDDPQIYARQGFYRGVIEMLSETLITPAETGAAGASRPGSRCKSLGEFWNELDDPKSALGRHATDIADLILRFHPERKPVLWRVLVAQHRLYCAFLQSLYAEDGAPSLPELTDKEVQALNWRGPGMPDDAILRDLRTADAYVREQVDDVLTGPGRSRAGQSGTRRATRGG